MPINYNSKDRQSGINREALIRLLEIKDIDIRKMTLEQARNAVDRGLHSGGAFSSIVPLVTLYYSGLIRVDVENPTSLDQDYCILSKGHAVAALASIYADMGYFPRSILNGSRSFESPLNGHPGPLLPGVHTATGPMGQGVCLAGGLAVAGRLDRRFDVFTMTGDGELQEGSAWEAIMYAGSEGNDNLCVIVDANGGQLDIHTNLHLKMNRLNDQFEAFGWRVLVADGTSHESVYESLHYFKTATRCGKPTAVICRTTKGWGGFSTELAKHKTTLSDDLLDIEIDLQERLRVARVDQFFSFIDNSKTGNIDPDLIELATAMNLEISNRDIVPMETSIRPNPAPMRDKAITGFDLPVLNPEIEYLTDEVVAMAMNVFARDRRVVSIDSDLSSTSGLQRGIAAVDCRRALNVGIAEANMMAMGEAFALLGYNTWVSTFCPFFNWNVFRRIAVSMQERLEVIASESGWLSNGHGLDLTFLATAPNFETKTNGATHMGNDDITTFRNLAHLKIIDVSCPNLLMSIIQWIMDGNRGLVYVRVMRAASKILYTQRPKFEFGSSFSIYGSKENCDITIISSGRGVHEAVDAAVLLEGRGISAHVIDMPSVDEQALLSLNDSNKPVVFPEQNNGYLYSEYVRLCANQRSGSPLTSAFPINVLGDDGNPQFIHSATYKELVEKFNLSSDRIADTCESLLSNK